MTKAITLIIVLITALTISCKEKDCSDYDLDFKYSLVYPGDSSYALVNYVDACDGLPRDSYFEWEVFGDSAEGHSRYANVETLEHTAMFTKNGDFSITMTVYANSSACCLTKEFEINAIK